MPFAPAGTNAAIYIHCNPMVFSIIGAASLSPIPPSSERLTADALLHMGTAKRRALCSEVARAEAGPLGGTTQRLIAALSEPNLWKVDLGACLDIVDHDIARGAGVEPMAVRERREWERCGLLAPLERVPEGQAYALLLALREALACALLGFCLDALQGAVEPPAMPMGDLREGVIRGWALDEGRGWEAFRADAPDAPWTGPGLDLRSFRAVRRWLCRGLGTVSSRLPLALRTRDPVTAMGEALMGTPVVLDGATLDPFCGEMLGNMLRDLFGGCLVPEEGLVREVERRRWACGLPHRYEVPAPARIGSAEIIEMGLRGAEALAALAMVGTLAALSRRGDIPIEYPETAYSLPCTLGWLGEDVATLRKLLEVLERHTGLPSGRGLPDALEAGRTAMVAAEALEALRYLEGDPHAGTATVGFVPDKVLRELGLAFVDDTIPGAAVLMGMPRDRGQLVATVRELQARGMLIMAVDDVVRVLQEGEVQMGLGMMLYPLGGFTQLVHALDFLVRAALSFGGVQAGDAERLSAYLAKRPKAFVLHYGPLDACRTAMALAALLHHVPIVTDQLVEDIPDLLFHKEPQDMLQGGLEARDIRTAVTLVDIPVPFGPAFEGETVRRPDTYFEAGGGRTVSYELLRMRPEDAVRDGAIIVIGPDVDRLPEGSQSPLAILVDVYGKRMQEDFEPVMERRIHLYLNFAEGVWHTGQRNMNWLRLSKKAFRAGLRLEHLGRILVTKLKEEFGNIVSRVAVTLITDEAEMRRRMPEALAVYQQREERMAGLTDDSVDTFYSCLMCQSFAPDHVCVITPERPGLCGAINWLDARTGKEIVPTGPNQPIAKGEPEDLTKGSWKGVNEAIATLTHGKIVRFCAYSLMEDPMTSCGCFECVVAMSPDMQSVIVVNREYAGMTPLGMRFSSLAGNIGGGRQTPGFIGIGRRYLVSKKFISADGGFLRIAWMPSSLKEGMREELINRAKELGAPDFLDKVADETVVTDAEGLMEWMIKVGHPALGMPPLL